MAAPWAMISSSVAGRGNRCESDHSGPPAVAAPSDTWRQLAAGVDAHSVRRENRPVGADLQTNLVSEISRLRASIDRAAAAAEITLTGHPPASADDDPRSPLAEYEELCRQLAALRERVAVAEYRNEGPRALRAELATLLFFGRTLQADADNWRSALEAQIKNSSDREPPHARSGKDWLPSARSLRDVVTHCSRQFFKRPHEWRSKTAENAAERYPCLRSTRASPSAQYRCLVPEEGFDSRGYGS